MTDHNADTAGSASAGLPSTTRTEEIYQAAVALFLERGYDATPLSVIAAKLGLTKAGLYHHFESKEDLLFHIHRHLMTERLLPVIEAAERESDPELRLRQYICDFTALMASDPAIRLLIEESKRLSPEHLDAIRAVWRRGYQLMRSSIEELKQSGRCKQTLDPTYAAFAAIGMCTWTLYWFDHDRPDTIHEISEAFSSIFLSGVLEDEAG